ncbi:hypothetical protein [Amphibiibacter pelophylacis]|uniref:Uncharacterized protein n=1 Tax=Amphibiibacter pelophylacis TaxID=1799477 RepID=A0ACC6P418_9BURK
MNFKNAPQMPFSGLVQSLSQAGLERVTLLANHVLSAEPEATRRLQAHVGHALHVHLDDWPRHLPRGAELLFLITPAGLLEAVAADDAAVALAPTLHVHLDASNPLALVGALARGPLVATQVAGPGALASDINWIIAHVRWDIEADLERWVGPSVAMALVTAGHFASSAVQQAASTLGALIGKRQ